jgi:hypothetical protein
LHHPRHIKGRTSKWVQKSIVARTTAKKAGERVGFERGGRRPDVGVG